MCPKVGAIIKEPVGVDYSLCQQSKIRMKSHRLMNSMYSSNPGIFTLPDGQSSAVVGQEYCAPHHIELTISTQVFSFKDRFNVRDINNNLLFKVKSVPFQFREKRIIHNAAGNPILTLRAKLWSFHHTWEAFRGKSSDPNDLIFTVKMSSLFQWKRKLKVYLAYNTTKELCDFMVKGSYFDRSCVVYAGESGYEVLAQMHKKFTAGSFFLGKDKFMVTVFPNVDHAFIVALLVILDEINSGSSG